MSRRAFSLVFCCLLVMLFLFSARLSYSQPDEQNEQAYLPYVNAACQQNEQIELPNDLQVGLTHIAGDYRFSDRNFLLEGAEKIASLGSESIFLYLIPRSANNFRQIYPDNEDNLWPSSAPQSLTELVQTAPYQSVLDMPFSTIVFTTYSYAVPDFFALDNPDPSYMAEEQEFYELTKYLLTTYQGCGKIFILKHWEGDSTIAFRYGTPEEPDWNADIRPEDADKMIRWLQARQRGVNRARDELRNVAGVKVFHAVEVNRVLDVSRNNKNRVLNSVVPHVNADMLSYSSWDAVFDGRGEISGGASRIQVETQLQEALTTIEQYAPDPLNLDRQRIFISEFGVRENYRPLLVEEAVQWCVNCTVENFDVLTETVGGINPHGLTFHNDSCPAFVVPAGISFDAWDNVETISATGPARLPKVCAASFRITVPATPPSGFAPSWRIDAVIKLASEFGLPYAFLWQLYDNDCRGANQEDLKDEVALGLDDPRRPTNETCPGNWLVRPDGTYSSAYPVIRNYWSATIPPTPPPLLPEEAVQWCAPNCTSGDFSPLEEVGGQINPHGLKFESASCPGPEFNIPAGITFDAANNQYFYSAISPAHLPSVCGASFRRVTDTNDP